MKAAFFQNNAEKEIFPSKAALANCTACPCRLA